MAYRGQIPLNGIREVPGVMWIRFAASGLRTMRSRLPMYLMIKPAPFARDQIWALEYCSRRRPPELLHMTIMALGDAAEWPPEAIDRLRTTLAGVAAAPFELCFDLIVGNGKHVALASSAPLEEAKAFKQIILDHFASQGLRLTERELRPHITLDYNSVLRCRERIDPIRWLVEDFVLVASVHGKQQHRELGRWSLRESVSQE